MSALAAFSVVLVLVATGRDAAAPRGLSAPRTSAGLVLADFDEDGRPEIAVDLRRGLGHGGPAASIRAVAT